MSENSSKRFRGISKARLVAIGFLLAFAASVLTVLYTGLMVEGKPSEFKAGFRSLTMRVNQQEAVGFEFEAFSREDGGKLELELPDMLELVDEPGTLKPVVPVAIVPGSNPFDVEIRAIAPGKGYVVARLVGEKPIGLDRVFVTVTEPNESE